MLEVVEKVDQRLAAALVVSGLAAAGVVDFVTGIEIRVFPLYFLSLALAAWRFGVLGASLAPIAATIVWGVSNWGAGLQYSSQHIWIVNGISQTVGFATVVLLTRWARVLLDHERSVSRTDSLTGLANARGFRSSVESVLAVCRRKGRPLAIAYIDIDNFKCVNDRFGHARGDSLLRDVAHVLRSTFRATDTVARVGGDEFVVCIPEASQAEVATVLERVHLALGSVFPFKECAVSASIGVSFWEAPPDDIDAMMSTADQVMYAVKNGGKNRVKVVSMV